MLPLKTLLLAATLLSGHWEGEAVHEGKTFRIHMDVAERDGAVVATVDYVDYALYGAPFVATAEGRTVRVERNPEGGPRSLVEGTVRGDLLTGTFTGAGAERAALRLRRTSRRARLHREIPVSWTNGDVRLEGTLVLPEGRGPFPAVVVTHGGAPEHRGQAGYWSAGVQFARSGVAALVYDKRGTGASTGVWSTAGLEELAGDALAGLRAIRSLEEVDPRRLGVTGHSQGGWISPLAATLAPDLVSFVVVTSPSGINAMEQSVFHTSNLLRQAGYSEEVVARAADLRNRMYARAKTGRVDDRFLADLERASREPWFETAALPWPWSETLADGTRRLLLFEPVPTWERVRVPVLAVWGSEDPNLPARRSRELVEAALARGGNRRATFVMLEGANHNLALAPPPGAWDFPRRPPRFASSLSTWLGQNVLARTKSA